MALVIVDTSIWIQYFRTPSALEGEEAERLIENGEAVMVGVVYTELLRGARNTNELEVLDGMLQALPFLEAGRSAWQRAGRLLFDLRRRGVTIPLADALIAALALESEYRVYSLDEHFQRVPGLRLHEV